MSRATSTGIQLNTKTMHDKVIIGGEAITNSDSVAQWSGAKNIVATAVDSSDGWTPQTIAEHLEPAFRNSFAPLDRSAEVFSWDPI